MVHAVEGLFFADNLFTFVVSFFFFFSRLCQCKLLLASPFLSFFFFLPRGRGIFVGGGVCNGRGLGPRLEAGPRLDKRDSPRVVSNRCWSLLLVGSLLLLSGVEQNVPAQLLCCASGWSCLISVASLASPVQWLLLWFCFRAESCESVEERKSCVCLELKWERTGNALTITRIPAISV